jgi:hypothetical protein
MAQDKPSYRKPSLQRRQPLSSTTASATKSISQKIFKVPD